jgi:preprotein translocase subunit SecB
MMEPTVAKHRPAPLRLRELVFPKISVAAVVPEGAADNSPRSLDLETVEIAFKYRLDHEAKVVPVGMRICSLPLPDGSTNKDRFYEVDVEAFAIFELVGAERQDEIVEYLRKVAAASALLGAIREQISMTTARGPWGVLTIPLISMDAIVGRPPVRTPPPTKVEGKKAAVSAAPKLSRKKTNEA